MSLSDYGEMDGGQLGRPAKKLWHEKTDGRRLEWEVVSLTVTIFDHVCWCWHQVDNFQYIQMFVFSNLEKKNIRDLWAEEQLPFFLVQSIPRFGDPRRCGNGHARRCRQFVFLLVPRKGLVKACFFLVVDFGRNEHISPKSQSVVYIYIHVDFGLFWKQTMQLWCSKLVPLQWLGAVPHCSDCTAQQCIVKDCRSAAKLPKLPHWDFESWQEVSGGSRQVFGCEFCEVVVVFRVKKGVCQWDVFLFSAVLSTVDWSVSQTWANLSDERLSLTTLWHPWLDRWLLFHYLSLCGSIVTQQKHNGPTGLFFFFPQLSSQVSIQKKMAVAKKIRGTWPRTPQPVQLP